MTVIHMYTDITQYTQPKGISISAAPNRINKNTHGCPSSSSMRGKFEGSKSGCRDLVFTNNG